MDLRRALPWLIVFGFSALLVTTWWASALAFFAFVPLAIITAVPWIGVRLLRRIGWTRLPLVGGLTGFKASGAFAGAAIAMLVIGGTVAPRVPSQVGANSTTTTAPAPSRAPATSAPSVSSATVTPSAPQSTPVTPTAAAPSPTPVPTTATGQLQNTSGVAPTQSSTPTAPPPAATIAPATNAPSTPKPTTLPLTPSPAPSVAATASLVITRLNYDGVVVQTESDEFVEITNRGGAPQDMSGWKIVSVRAGQTYSFPAMTIQAGQTCRVYTNEIHPEFCSLSFGLRNAIWNNNGDRANLVSPTGAVISSVGYRGY